VRRCDVVAHVMRTLGEYADLVDEGKFDQVADLLGDCTIDISGEGGSLSGRDRIYQMFASRYRIYSDGTPRTSHHITNVVVDVGDSCTSATSRCRYVVFQVTTPMNLAVIAAGRFHDYFALTTRGWRLTHRDIFRDLVGDLSGHVIGGNIALKPGGEPDA
jgi:hypothetical protein